jgi:Mg2+/Co2+ transporter CorB
MFLNYLLGALWITSYVFLVLISAIKLRLPHSVYQLKLSNKKGSKDAAKWLWYYENRSVLHSILKLKRGLLGLVFTTLSLKIFGFGFGFIIALLMFVALIKLDNLSLTKQLGQKLFWWAYSKIGKNIKGLSKYFNKLGLSKKDEDSHTPPVASVDELLNLINANAKNLPEEEYRQVTRLLDIQDVKIHDIMLPKNRIAFVDAVEIMTPKLIDQLHKTHNGFALVFDADIKNVIGILNLGGPDLLEQIKTPTRVADYMQKGLCYLPEHATVSTFIASAVETRQPVFAVVDSKSNISGVMSFSLMFEWQYGLELPSHELDSITWNNPEAMARYEIMQRTKTKE